MSQIDDSPRAIKGVHSAIRADMPGLATVQALPNHGVQRIDPFLLLNHHGPEIFPPQNNGLPFEPHPHRGMQTVTFIIEGDVSHRDNATEQTSVIEQGGVQWMIAGKGLLHLETTSDEFKKSGGPLEILQLWINLPARHKMVDPSYFGLQNSDIPVFATADGKTDVRVIAGEYKGVKGAVEPLDEIDFYWLNMTAAGQIDIAVPATKNIFCYVVRGCVDVNGHTVSKMQLVDFSNGGSDIVISATEDSLVLFGFAEPYDEPVAWHGPFVMNTEQEIRDAIVDLQTGKMGKWRP